MLLNAKEKTKSRIPAATQIVLKLSLKNTHKSKTEREVNPNTAKGLYLKLILQKEVIFQDKRYPFCQQHHLQPKLQL